MEKRDHSRARSCFISFVVLLATIYVILVTVFIATLYHFTVSQSERIRTLEEIAGKLAARVHKLENSFTAQMNEKISVGETNQQVQKTTEEHPKNKVDNNSNAITVLVMFSVLSKIMNNLSSNAASLAQLSRTCVVCRFCSR